ncbi:hypothetical protein ACM66B_002921 [Microbotryomycetes sp. NB124-2]
MLWWSRQPASVTCPYCLAQLELVPPQTALKGKHRAHGSAVGSSSDFVCSDCTQRVQYDKDGTLVPDLAAQRNAEMNDESFSKRATPTRNSLPPTFFRSPLCRNCITNAQLQIQLLASFPDGEDDSRLDNQPSAILEEYRRSLDKRYPIVCEDCAPTVEQVIASRDSRAKASALGWRLRESAKRKAEHQWRNVGRRNSWRWQLLGWLWTLRGIAWWMTHVTCVLGCASAATWPGLFVAPNATTSQHTSPFLLPALSLLSLLWSFWDPTWMAAREEASLGKPARVEGRTSYQVLQAVAWTARLALTLLHQFRLIQRVGTVQQLAMVSAVSFFCICVASLRTIRLRRPVSVQLGGRKTRVEPASSVDPLSLLSDLQITPDGKRATCDSAKRRGLLFAKPSDSSQPALTARRRDEFVASPLPEEEEMDWTPELSSQPRESYWSRLAPQRFFAAEKSLGLEPLLERSLKME